MKKRIVILGIIDLLAIACYILFYGPWDGFRNYLITTAMNTKSHQYIAKVFYSQEKINEVLSLNLTISVNEETDASMIDFKLKDKQVFDSIYEEEILTKDPDNDLYKIIEFDGHGYHAYLTVIYDPTRVSTVKSEYYGSRGEYVSTMAQKSGAIIAINGGAFIDLDGMSLGGLAAGTFISNGEVIEKGKCGVIGLTDKGILTLGEMDEEEALEKGIKDAVCFGPFLIVNGKSATIVGNGGYGVDPRTAIAQRRDGIILFLTIDGSGNKYGFRGGASMAEVISIFERYGAYNAANLDGGASTVLAINGKVYNNPVAYSSSGERGIPNGWIVK